MDAFIASPASSSLDSMHAARRIRRLRASGSFTSPPALRHLVSSSSPLDEHASVSSDTFDDPRNPLHTSARKPRRRRGPERKHNSTAPLRRRPSSSPPPSSRRCALGQGKKHIPIREPLNGHESFCSVSCSSSCSSSESSPQRLNEIGWSLGVGDEEEEEDDDEEEDKSMGEKRNSLRWDCVIDMISRRAFSLPEIPYPTLPKAFYSKMSVSQRIVAIQQFINAFEYNYHEEVQFFNLKKQSRPVRMVIETAKEMIREALPIRCLDAVFLGIYLTQDIPELWRVPLKFKSKITYNNAIYRHIVLALRYKGMYGAIGISRRKHLFYKPLKFESFSSLVQNYLEAYERLRHQVIRVKFGLPVPHDSTSSAAVCWKFFSLNPRKVARDDLLACIDQFSEDSDSLADAWYCAMKIRHPSSSGSVRKDKSKYLELDSGDDSV